MTKLVDKVIELAIERAEQACRYSLKHMVFEEKDTDRGKGFAEGFELATQVCEGAIKDNVMRHIKKDIEREGISGHGNPMTSVIEWTRYDGTPETLPEEDRWVVTSEKHFNGKVYTEATVSTEDFYEYEWLNTGDLWAYLPNPPDA